MTNRMKELNWKRVWEEKQKQRMRPLKKVVAIESSETAVNYLRRNMKETQVENVEIANRNWMALD
ncbi:hypothetical protein DRN97_02820 [Methanosarcinales archaeon]|nr:MAG: hypothetical protein DRN97_02820 [Methanosarcinales archaeon]